MKFRNLNLFKKTPKNNGRKQKTEIFTRSEDGLVIKIDAASFWKWTAISFVALFVFTQTFGINIHLLSRLGAENNEEGRRSLANPNSGQNESAQPASVNLSKLQEKVLPSGGVVLPIQWNDLGKKLVEAGVIDITKLESLYSQRGGLSDQEKNLLAGKNNSNIKLDKQSAQFILNLLWAFGLANKNPVLDEGPMQDPRYGGADRFASTGGWTLSKGNAMNHYSKYDFVRLTSAQQQLLEKVSKGVYRPCCGNSTYFPDCNHGMAMLGLLELLAANGASEEEMYQIALKVNSFWFPDTYLTLARYFEEQGVKWDNVDAGIVLGANYSSSSGYNKIVSEVQPVQSGGGGGCGV